MCVFVCFRLSVWVSECDSSCFAWLGNREWAGIRRRRGEKVIQVVTSEYIYSIPMLRIISPSLSLSNKRSVYVYTCFSFSFSFLHFILIIRSQFEFDSCSFHTFFPCLPTFDSFEPLFFRVREVDRKFIELIQQRRREMEITSDAIWIEYAFECPYSAGKRKNSQGDWNKEKDRKITGGGNCVIFPLFFFLPLDFNFVV